MKGAGEGVKFIKEVERLNIETKEQHRPLSMKEAYELAELYKQIPSNQRLAYRTIERRISMNAKHEKQKNDEKDWIEEFNKKTIHYVFTVFVSMMTAIIVVLAATGQL